MTRDSSKSHFYKISEFLIDKLTSFAHKEFNTMLTERLQHLHQSWARLFEMTESERDK